MFVHCMWCGADTGMRSLDPWSIPYGVRASLIVSCGQCIAKHEGTKPLIPWLATRPEGEAPQAERRPRTASVLVVPVRDGFEAVAVVDGVHVGHSSNRARAVDALSEGSKVLIQHLLDVEHAGGLT